jgi:predicted CopG family antitoxin
MSKSNSPQNAQDGGKPPMVTRSISIHLDVWEQAQKKAGMIPMSAIIRRLIAKWLKGEIELD